MHIMIDLETMGTRPNAPIVSIGAVFFDKDHMHDRFYDVIDLRSAVAAGADMDPGTVIWWLQQSDEARAALTGAGRQISEVLDEFAKFVRAKEVAGVWGNGAAFDNVILAEAYKRLDMETPWPFWKDKCYRTIKNAYPEVEIRRAGTHHNALSDAATQAEHLIRINKAATGIIL